MSAITFDDSIIIAWHANSRESESRLRNNRQGKKNIICSGEVRRETTDWRDRCYLSRRDVNWFVDDQPDRRFPTTRMRCTTLVSHVTIGFR